jgi:hypothetical protein
VNFYNNCERVVYYLTNQRSVYRTFNQNVSHELAIILPNVVNGKFRELYFTLNVSCVPQKTHSQQAMTKMKYVLVPDVK